MIPSIYRYVAWGLAALAVAGALLGYGFIKGDDHGQGVVRAADAKAQQAVYARFEWNMKNGQKLADERAADDAAAAVKIHKLLQEIADDQHPTVAAPGASTSVPVLTLGAVGLFNDAWAGDELPGGTAAAGTAPGAAASIADAKGASGFNVADALYSDGFDAGVCWQWIRAFRKLEQYERDRGARAGQH